MALGLPRAEMLERMSSAELTEWAAFHNLEPFGGDADYLGDAITASTVANVNRGKGQKPYKVEDFMPKFEKKEQSIDQMVQIAAIVTASLGGQDMRSDEPSIPDLEDEDD
jgi:hypothetical protein